MWEKATGMKARQTLSETWWAELTWKGTATAPSKQSVKPFRAETARWRYGGPQGYQKRCGSKSKRASFFLRLPLDKSMALDAFWPEPETITLKMLWVLKGCEIKIKTETKKLPLAWYWEKETVNLDLRIDCNLLDNRL